MRGRRLVFTQGILALAVLSAALLIAFGGITDRLIPLFAIGAFLAFTMSQVGMVVHWRRQAETKAGLGNHGRLAINAIGAAASAAVLIVTVITKFAEGAWIILLVVPLFVLLLTRVKRYYVALDRETRDCDRIELEDAAPPVFLVAMENWNRLTCRALGLALRLSPDVAAVHLSSLSGPEAEEMQQRLRREWRADVEEPARRAGRPAPRLIFLETPFRRMREPLLRLIHAIERELRTARSPC